MGNKLRYIPSSGNGLLVVKRVAILTLLNFICISAPLAGDSPSIETPAFDVLAGSWTRTDGNYVIRVGGIKADGSVAAEYFNPKQIHVSQANASVEKKLVKLYVKLQGKGYPGSTYSLYYYAEKDALVGFYYQAVLGQTFEVVFLRTRE